MTTLTSEEQLEDYLFQGISKEIFFAEEAKAMAAEIGNYSAAVNANGYGLTFGSIQLAYSDRQSLCIAKIFDPPSRSYPTRTILTTMEIIERNASVWALPQKEALVEMLIAAGANTASTATLNNADLALAVASHYRATLPTEKGSDPLSVALQSVRGIRNKVIAHNEAVPAHARIQTTWGQAQSLVDYAKGFVVTIGIGFLGLLMTDSQGEHRFFGDTPDMSTTGLRRLMEHAGMSEN